MVLDRGRVTTLASHLAVVLAFAVETVRQLPGWQAVSDDAAMAMKSYNELSREGSLLGPHTVLAASVTARVFDPGPLLFWLLALPVRIDPRHGALWGAALWCVVAGMLAVAAARRWAGPVGGIGAALAVVWSVACVPAIAENPVWNIYLGDMFLLAAIAAALAAMTGSAGFWPVAVVTASVAMQDHLVFCLPSALLVLVSGAVVLVLSKDRPRARVGIALGVLGGVACWIAPLIQEVSGHPPNLTVLIRDAGGRRSTGLGFGLHALSAATLPSAAWWTPVQHLDIDAVIKSAPVAFGAAMLVATSAAALAGWRHDRRLVALAVVALLLDACLVVSYSTIPLDRLETLRYLVVVLLPAGTTTWCSILWAAALLLLTPSLRTRASVPSSPRMPAVLTAVALALLAAASVTAQLNEASYRPTMETSTAMSVVQHASSRIEQLVAPGPLLVHVTVAGRDISEIRYSYTYGIAWELQQQGWSPTIAGADGRLLGQRYVPSLLTRVARVHVAGRHVAVAIAEIGPK